MMFNTWHSTKSVNVVLKGVGGGLWVGTRVWTKADADADADKFG